MTIDPTVRVQLEAVTTREDLDELCTIHDLDGVHTAHAQADDPTGELNRLFLDADTILQWIQRPAQHEGYGTATAPTPVEQVRLVRPDGTDA